MAGQQSLARLDRDSGLRISIHVFRETLTRQMLAYNLVHHKYIGDDLFRATTIQTKAKRARSPVFLHHKMAPSFAVILALLKRHCSVSLQSSDCVDSLEM